MRLTDYEQKVLEVLSMGTKNIYQVFKVLELEKGSEVHYPTIQRTVKRLQDKRFIEMTGRGVRNAKEYEITLLGMLGVYSVKCGESNRLEFHRSKEAQEIVDRIIKVFFKGEAKRKEENLFLRVLRISPSFIEFLPILGDIARPRIIRDPHLFLEVFRSSADSSPGHIVLEKLDENDIHPRFVARDLPLKILAKDFKRYPDDNEIKKLFSSALMEKYKTMGRQSLRQRKEAFNTILKAVRDGAIDPKESADKEWRKFEEYITREEKKRWENVECWKHWYIYLPPLGEPRLVCDGKCSIP